MKIVNEDILSGLGVLRTSDKKVVVLHCCNCHHKMGAGIAKYLRSVHPEVYKADVQQTKLSDRGKLGTYSTAIIEPSFHILNCYGQYNYARHHGEINVDYDAIRSCLRRVAMSYNNWEMRMPKLGCDRAGGDWNIVKRIIEEELPQQQITIYWK
jgi:hypothetical protein